MLERFAATDDWMIAEGTAKGCLLLPPEPTELDQARRLNERALATIPGSASWAHPWAQLTRGLVEYRSGRPRESIRWLARALAGDQTDWQLRVQAHLMLAMAYLRLGEVEAARAARAKAIAIEQDEMSRLGCDELGEAWHGWLIRAVLRREADALFLDRDFPADPFARAE
jgi:Flp pilus assembly protein TadD